MYLGSLCSYSMAMLGDESLYSYIMGEADFREEDLSKMNAPDLLIMEAVCLKDLERMKIMRGLFPETEILIISRGELSPEYYLNPEILPSMLMMKPYTVVKAQKVIKSFLTYYCVKRGNGAGSGILPIMISGEVYYFHFTEIRFFEAKEKKVILHSRSRELSFNDTLQYLEQKLPGYFIRCHRSFIVNSLFVKRTDLSKGLIYTEDEAVIPLSKKYIKHLKELLQK